MSSVLKNDEFISTKEAAQLSSYSLKTVRNWAKKYKQWGLSFKHANKWYVHKDRYLKSVLSE